MGTPENTPSNPHSWVRGPKTGQPAAPGGGPTTPRPAPTPGPPATPRPGPVPGHGPAPAARRRSVAPRKAPAVTGGEAPWAEPGPRTPVRGTSPDGIGWVKAHGGAGATSLAEALGGADIGARWPEPARGEPRRIVLVGRTSARGLRAVSRALGALRDGKAPQGLDLLAVVLVADAPGRLPLGLLRRIRVVRSVAPVQRVPWIPAWRVGGQPKYLPRQLSALADLVGADGERTAS
ncbi:hypothetical protein SUDANB108_05742 [Streptomyces sp. enrichment culture]|uniref:hypothetical protein n=1 Tax=Streptomyces sp. enrichment culture TaxID=1795815 RepID=UPI003F57F2D5